MELRQKWVIGSLWGQRELRDFFSCFSLPSLLCPRLKKTPSSTLNLRRLCFLTRVYQREVSPLHFDTKGLRQKFSTFEKQTNIDKSLKFFRKKSIILTVKMMEVSGLVEIWSEGPFGPCGRKGPKGMSFLFSFCTLHYLYRLKCLCLQNSLYQQRRTGVRTFRTHFQKWVHNLPF